MAFPLRTAGLGLAALALVGCATPNPAVDNHATGALLGAAAGAAAGNLIRGDSRGTLVGAAAGALAGAAIGNALDRQAAELQQGLAGSGAGVVNTGSQLVVNLPEAITFATGSAALDRAFVDEIALVAASLGRYPETTVEIIGHTDNVGSENYNLGLSQRRAQAVADVLLAEGVAPWRIRTRGVGFSRPVATNDTEAGRAANRRVEIVITPMA